MTRLAASLLLVLTLLAGACSMSADIEQRLRAAESIIDERPDSALAILRGIDASTLSGEPRARHALLLSKAYDKNYIDIADDSIIDIAFDYYSRFSAPDAYHIAAHYYKANVAFNASNYPSAIFHAIVADTLASISGDLHYRGMANNLIALSYNQLNDFKKELGYAEKSYNFFKQNNDSVRSRLTLMDIGICYLYLKDYEKAFEILTDSDCKVWNQGIAESLIGMNKLQDYRDFIQSHPELTTSPRLNSLYAKSLIDIGNYQEADSLIDIAKKYSVNFSDSSFYLMTEAELFSATKQWEKLSQIAIYANHRENAWLNKVYSEYDSRGQLLAHEYIMTLEAERDHQQHLKLILTIVSLVIILLVSILIGINRRTTLAKRLLEKELMIRDVLQENANASNRIESLTANIQALQAELESDNRSIASSINSSSQATLTTDDISDLASFVANIKDSLQTLCNRYQHTSSSDKTTIAGITRDIQDILTPDTVRHLEQYIDALFGGLAIRTRRAGFPDKEILLLSLIRLGFANSEIALFLDTSYAAVSKRKSRLLSRLTEAGIIEQMRK